MLVPKRPAVNPKLWSKMNAYIRQEQGWTVSQPDTNPVRFECKLDSELPALLIEAGHSVRGLGTHERLLPSTLVEQRGTATFTTQSVAPGVVNVYSFDLPVLPEKPKQKSKSKLLIQP